MRIVCPDSLVTGGKSSPSTTNRPSGSGVRNNRAGLVARSTGFPGLRVDSLAGALFQPGNQSVDTGEHQRIENDRQDSAGQDEIASLFRQKL